MSRLSEIFDNYNIAEESLDNNNNFSIPAMEAFVDAIQCDMLESAQCNMEYEFAIESISSVSKAKKGFNTLKNSKNKKDIAEAKEDIDEAIEELKEEEAKADTPEKKKLVKKAIIAILGIGSLVAAGIGLSKFGKSAGKKAKSGDANISDIKTVEKAVVTQAVSNINNSGTDNNSNDRFWELDKYNKKLQAENDNEFKSLEEKRNKTIQSMSDRHKEAFDTINKSLKNINENHTKTKELQKQINKVTKGKSDKNLNNEIDSISTELDDLLKDLT